jgi:cell wall-associated NlpC family hydrolase
LQPHQHATRRRRIVATVVGAAAAVALVAGSVGPAAAAPRPSGVAGNHHSPAVAALAVSALEARDVYAWTGEAGAYQTYLGRLQVTADAVAMEFSTDPAVVRGAFERSDFEHQTAALAALSQLGKPYRYATSDPGVGFDCSGLTAFAWRRAGVSLPQQSGAQMSVSPGVDPAVAEAGDLVQYPGHVMMYLGFGDAIVHAANSQNDVELSHARRGPNWANPTGR